MASEQQSYMDGAQRPRSFIDLQGTVHEQVLVPKRSYVQGDAEPWHQPEAYMVTMPPEAQVAFPGRNHAVAGIVCSVIALMFQPIVFGLAGIVFGVVARKKGARTLGLVTVLLAICFSLVGMLMHILLSLDPHVAAVGVAGYALQVFVAL